MPVSPSKREVVSGPQHCIHVILDESNWINNMDILRAVHILEMIKTHNN